MAAAYRGDLRTMKFYLNDQVGRSHFPVSSELPIFHRLFSLLIHLLASSRIIYNSTYSASISQNFITMGLSKRAVLDIVILVFYVPVFCLSVWVVFKHGFGRQLGWIYLAILAILRIVGGGTGIAASQNPSQGLIETSTICFSVGLSPLFLALLGFVSRVNQGMHSHQIPQRIIQLIHLPILVALIFAILGGTKSFDSDPSSRNTGYTDTKVAVILFIVSLIALIAVTVITFRRIRHAMDGEKRLIYAAAASLPFLGVRMIYSIIVSFDHTSTVFSITSTRNAAVVAQAIMSVATEFIVVSVFLAAGFATPAIPRSMVDGSNTGYQADAPRSQQPYYSPGASYPMTDGQGQDTGSKLGQERGVTGGSYVSHQAREIA